MALNEETFLKKIGFALSGISEPDIETKLVFLDLIAKEVEAQKEILKQNTEEKKKWN